MKKNEKHHVNRNRKIHDKIAVSYSKNHDEIFNEREQLRIQSEIKYCRGLLNRDAIALDFGCGNGNLTRHLRAENFNVVAADVSQSFLDLVSDQFGVSTKLLSGKSDLDFDDATFDLICVYSVLHHLPDYLKVISEFARILKPGGILYIDHEPSPDYWLKHIDYIKNLKSISKINFKKYFKIGNYYHKIMSLFINKYSNEGDIHVWPDQHIEWSKIDSLLSNEGLSVLKVEDYLLFKKSYDIGGYERLKNKYKDVRSTIYIKL